MGYPNVLNFDYCQMMCHFNVLFTILVFKSLEDYFRYWFFLKFCSFHKYFSFEDELGIKDEIKIQRYNDFMDSFIRL